MAGTGRLTGENVMDLLHPWWLVPLILFVLPMVVGLFYNRLRWHRNGVNQNWVLGLFVSVCWLAAIIVILNKLR